MFPQNNLARKGLRHCGLLMSYDIMGLVNIGSGQGLYPGVPFTDVV